MKNGIDVSYHNGEIDWVKVKNSGVDFAILRCGFGRENPNQIDKQFERNYREAKALGIPVGVYHYSYAKSPEMAEKEAEFCLKLIKNKQFEFPIYFDIEDEKVHKPLDKKTCSEIVVAFCSKIEKEGYWAGVYSYDSFFSSHLYESIQNRYTTWVANISREPIYCKRVDIWQNSFTGKVDGITGNNGDVDTNICYRDLPSAIKKAKKNGFDKSESYIPEKMYKISAIKENLTAEKANDLENILKNQGMTVRKEVL